MKKITLTLVVLMTFLTTSVAFAQTWSNVLNSPLVADTDISVSIDVTGAASDFANPIIRYCIGAGCDLSTTATNVPATLSNESITSGIFLTAGTFTGTIPGQPEGTVVVWDVFIPMSVVGELDGEDQTYTVGPANSGACTPQSFTIAAADPIVHNFGITNSVTEDFTTGAVDTRVNSIVISLAIIGAQAATEMQAEILEGATVLDISSIEAIPTAQTSGELTLNFAIAPVLTANTTYTIRFTGTDVTVTNQALLNLGQSASGVQGELAYTINYSGIVEVVLPAGGALGTVTDTTAAISWTEETDVTYEAKVVADGAGDAAADIGSTTVSGGTASATGLTAETAYDFYVRGMGTCDEIVSTSDWVLVDFMTTAAGDNCNIIDAASIGATDITQTTATITFTPAATGADGSVPNTAQILVFRSDNTVDFNQSGVDVSQTSGGTVAVTGLIAGTEYSVRFLSQTCSGTTTIPDGPTSITTAAGVFTTTACAAPADPVPVEDAVTETAADISWTVVTGATSYDWKVVADGAGVAAAAVAGNESTAQTGASASASGLTAGTAYDFYVRANTDCGGGSTLSSAWVLLDFMTVACATPADPVPVEDAVTETAADISWPVVTGATSYDWKVVADGAGVAAAAVAGNEATAQPGASAGISGLTAGTAYDFYVRANIECSGSSSSSAWVLLDFILPCPVPTNFMLDSIGEVTDTTADLIAEFAAVGSTNLEFVVMADTVSPDVATAISTSGLSASSLFEATGLTASTNYDAYVRSFCPDSSTFSDWVGPVEFMTTSLVLPELNVTVTPTTVGEDSGTSFIYTITRTGPTTSALNFNINNTGSDADASDFSSSLFTAFTFNVGASFIDYTVTPSADTDVEPDEDFIVQIETNAAVYTIGTNGSATGTIINDDTDPGLAEVLEDSASTGGANNANGTAVTAAQLAAITGIMNVDPANEAAYQAAIAAETGFSNPPTVMEVQAIIDAVNTAATDSNAALAEVLEDSASTGGANNGNGTAVTAAQLDAITGITGVDPANEAGYQAVIAAETGFSNPPTVAQVQAIIDEVNNVAIVVTSSGGGTLTQGELDNAGVTPGGFTPAEIAAIQSGVAAAAPAPITTVDLQMIVDDALSTLSTDSFELANLSMLPNPATSVVTFRGVELSGITVYSITGSKVLEVKNNNTINISSLQKGIYLVKVESLEGAVTKKLIVE